MYFYFLISISLSFCLSISILFFSFYYVCRNYSLKDPGSPNMRIWAKANAEKRLASLHRFLLLVPPAATPGRCRAATPVRR